MRRRLPLGGAVLRDQHHAGVDRVLRPGDRDGLTGDADLALHHTAHAARWCARATTGRTREVRRCRRPRRDAPSGRQLSGLSLARYAAQLQQTSPLALASRVTSASPSERLPTMCSIIVSIGSSRERRGDHMPPVAQDRGAVGDAGDLVHAVANVDDRVPLRLQLRKEDEQPLDVLTRRAPSRARRASGRGRPC